MKTHLDYGNFFRFSKGTGRGSEIFHTNESKHKCGENSLVIVEEKKETLIR